MSQRVFEYVEPGDDGEPVIIRMTEGEILAFYWDWWSGAMRAKLAREGKVGCGINPDSCIEDFAAVHWASEIKP